MEKHSLEKQIEEFENTAEGHGYGLRLDLSEIILRHLNATDMTQAKLAEKAKTSPQLVTRIIHAASNCTLQTAADLLFALGVRVKLVEVQPGSLWAFEQETRATNSSRDIEYKSLSLDAEKRAALPVGESRLNQLAFGWGRV